MALNEQWANFCKRAVSFGKQRRRQKQACSIVAAETLDTRELLSGIGGVTATVVETPRDFAFNVSGRARGTTTAPNYKDSYTATLLAGTKGSVSFSSPTRGSGSVSGTARIVGRDTFESYNYVDAISGSGNVNDGVLSNIRSPGLPPGLSVSGNFNPLTWAVETRWNGTVDGAKVSGSFNGSVSQTLPKTDFLASVVFDTSAADAIHTDKTFVKDVAAKVKARVTIDVVGQHMKAATMGTTVTTARIYLDSPNTGTQLVTPIPIHWNTGTIVVDLENFLNKTNKSGKLYVVFDQEKNVEESNESNNSLSFDIPYDIRATGIGWLNDRSVLGSYRIDVAGLNNTSLGSTSARLYFANAKGQFLDANPKTTVINPLFMSSPGFLSKPTFTNGDFGAFTTPLNWRPQGTTQIILTLDRYIIPPNAEINELNNNISLKLSELSSKGLAVFPNGASRMKLNVSNAALAFPTVAALHWASGNPGNYKLLKWAAQVNLAKGANGDLTYNFAANGLTARPSTATSLVVVVDPAITGKAMGRILEPNENNTFLLNSTPRNLVLSKSTIDENQSRFTEVGLFSASHSDAYDGLTYKLVPGVGSTDNTKFRLSTAGRLTSNTVFNFEARSRYAIRVEVKDRLGFSIQKVFIINVTDVNESSSSVASSIPAAARPMSPAIVNDSVRSDDVSYAAFHADDASQWTEEPAHDEPSDMYRAWIDKLNVGSPARGSAVGSDLKSLDGTVTADNTVNSPADLSNSSLDSLLGAVAWPEELQGSASSQFHEPADGLSRDDFAVETDAAVTRRKPISSDFVALTSSTSTPQLLAAQDAVLSEWQTAGW